MHSLNQIFFSWIIPLAIFPVNFVKPVICQDRLITWEAEITSLTIDEVFKLEMG